MAMAALPLPSLVTMHQSVRDVIADMSFLCAVSDVRLFYQTKSIVEMDLGPTA
jgi:hypothetical protein